MFNSTYLTREQIQDGQHLANQIIEKIKKDIADRGLKYIAVETFKDELYNFIKNLKHEK